MATKPAHGSETDLIMEAIRQLKLALAKCQKLMDEYEQPHRKYAQDNDPPHPS